MFVMLGVVVIMAVLAIAPRRSRLAGEAQTAAVALLEFQDEWRTNGNDMVFYRGHWSARFKAMGMNSMEVGWTVAGASKREDGPWGIWWSQGYKIQRQRTNDNRWAFYRTHAFGLPKRKGLTWRSRLTVFTYAPGGLTNGLSQ